MVIAIIVVVLMTMFGITLFCIAPNRGREEQMMPYRRKFIAHRGLFNHTDAPENSMPAFRRAVESGYGIELDVQLTRDGKLVVFHDPTLTRVCGINRMVRDCTYEELQGYVLEHSEERIPLFEEVLRLVDGAVPLVIELKPEGGWRRTAELMAGQLDDYNGLYCIESFHPLAVEWFRKNRPEVLRGQLATGFFHDIFGSGNVFAKMLSCNLLLNFKSRPDFVAYNVSCAFQPFFLMCKWLFPVVTVAWTVRSPRELAKAKKHFHAIIFDNFIPEDETRGDGCYDVKSERG